MGAAVPSLCSHQLHCQRCVSLIPSSLISLIAPIIINASPAQAALLFQLRSHHSVLQRFSPLLGAASHGMFGKT